MKIFGTRFPIWLVAVYVVSLLAIAIWPFTALTSAMVFDAPGSSNIPSNWVGFWVLVCWPVLPVAAVLISFFAYKREHKALAYVLAAVAALPAITLILVFGISTVTSILYGMGVLKPAGIP